MPLLICTPGPGIHLRPRCGMPAGAAAAAAQRAAAGLPLPGTDPLGLHAAPRGPPQARLGPIPAVGALGVGDVAARRCDGACAGPRHAGGCHRCAGSRFPCPELHARRPGRQRRRGAGRHRTGRSPHPVRGRLGSTEGVIFGTRVGAGRARLPRLRRLRRDRMAPLQASRTADPNPEKRCRGGMQDFCPAFASDPAEA